MRSSYSITAPCKAPGSPLRIKPATRGLKPLGTHSIFLCIDTGAQPLADSAIAIPLPSLSVAHAPFSPSLAFAIILYAGKALRYAAVSGYCSNDT